MNSIENFRTIVKFVYLCYRVKLLVHYTVEHFDDSDRRPESRTLLNEFVNVCDSRFSITTGVLSLNFVHCLDEVNRVQGNAPMTMPVM
jgi:hypothetical protein